MASPARSLRRPKLKSVNICLLDDLNHVAIGSPGLAHVGAAFKAPAARNTGSAVRH